MQKPRFDGTANQDGLCLCRVHPRARREVAKDAAGVQTGIAADRSSVVQVLLAEIPFDQEALEKYGWSGTHRLCSISYPIWCFSEF